MSIELKRQNEHFLAVQRMANVGTWEVDLIANNLFWSEQTYLIHDTTPEKYTPSFDTAIQFYADEYVAIISEAFQRAVETGNGYELELELITAKNRRIWVMAYATVVKEEGAVVKIYGVIQDIDDLKRTRLELEKSEFLFRSQFDLGRTGLAITSLEKGWLKVNTALTEITGYSKSELFNMTWVELTHPDDLDLDISHFNKLLSGESDNYQMDKRYIRKDGAIVHVHITVACYRKNGVIEFFIASIQDINERVLSEHRIKKLAHYDSLTGLPNRIMAETRFEHSMQSAQRNNNLVCILFLDLDEFKNINDSLGHNAGDSFLKEIAQRLTSIVRKSDTVCRQGGDEFLVIVESTSDERQLLVLAQKILQKIKKPFNINGVDVSTSVSIGIAIAPNDGDNFESLCRHADMAMYQAKKAGRNSFHFYNQKLEQEAELKLKLLSDLRLAVEQKQFELYFQPKIDLVTDQLYGAEALIRWHHPERGIVSPLDFIPLAESSGLIIELGQWVLEEACRKCQAWQKEMGKELSVAVNVSAVQFKREDFYTLVESTLADTQLPPQFLELEITESLMVADTKHHQNLFKQLNALGVRVSIDDFGTGYSSLAYLKKLQIDTLKIDRSFIFNMLDNEQELAIVEAILQMAKSLQLNVVAEGVEDNNVAQKLRSLNCQYGQGFYWSKPLTNKQFINFNGKGSLH